MIIEDIKFVLKDGREAVLRNPKEEDINGTLEYLAISAEETDFLLRIPEECNAYTYEGEKEIFKYKNESEDGLTLVCSVDGKIAGSCEITFNNKYKIKHRASVAIALIKEFWGLGIGSKMLETLICVAKERGGVSQIELEVVEGNVRAISLYEKLGFKRVGVHPNAIKSKDGTLMNEFLMIKEL